MNRILHIGKSALRTGWTAANLIIGTITVVSAYCGYIPPEKFVAAQALNMVFPLFALLCFLMLVADLFIYRRSMLIAGCALLISTPLLLDVCPVRFGTPRLTDEEENRAFTFLSYNTYHFVNNHGDDPYWGSMTMSNIIASDADIVCIQEGGALTGWNAVGSAAQRDTLRHRYPYIIETPERAAEILLSKYPATLLDTPQPVWGSGQYSAYRLDVDGRRLTVINCHLQSIGLTPDDKEVYRELTDREIKRTREELSQAKADLLPKLFGAFKVRAEQARSIKAFIDSVGGNILLAGDFNDVAGSYAYRTIRSTGLRDAYSDTAFGPTFTYNTNRFYFHIDQVLYRGDLKAVETAIGDSRSSDHYPVTATFIWDKPGEK